MPEYMRKQEYIQAWQITVVNAAEVAEEAGVKYYPAGENGSTNCVSFLYLDKRNPAGVWAERFVHVGDYLIRKGWGPPTKMYKEEFEEKYERIAPGD